jgi:hypothetical protein
MEVLLPEATLQLDVACRFCGSKHVVRVFESDFKAWLYGKLIQDTMPYLTPDQRELLVSEVCGACWEDVLGPEE